MKIYINRKLTYMYIKSLVQMYIISALKLKLFFTVILVVARTFEYIFSRSLPILVIIHPELSFYVILSFLQCEPTPRKGVFLSFSFLLVFFIGSSDTFVFEIEHSQNQPLTV